jgi:cytochrome b
MSNTDEMQQFPVAQPSLKESSLQRTVPVQIWDLPVRLAHWILVVLLPFSWITGALGVLTWHRWSGYTILTLVLFRIYWGFAGSGTARFSHFVRGPHAIWRDCQTLFEPLSRNFPGHTPLAGWSIVAMLVVLLLQTGLGLFAVDVDGIGSGPLSGLVSFEIGRNIATWHAKVVNVLLALIALHIAAVLYYWAYKRDNLILPMLTGIKHLPTGMPPPISIAIFWRAVLGLTAIVLVLVTVLSGLRF